MRVFYYTWRTTGVGPVQSGTISVRSGDSILALIFARREVRLRCLPGFDFGKITLTERSDDGAETNA